MKCGFVAVVGRPNVGKSTTLNALVKEKATIVSDKPQTTRYKIKVILTRSDAQIIFVDTPGFHKPKDALGSYLNSHVESVLNDVDLILFMVDTSAGIGKGDAYLADLVKKAIPKKILVLNKIDLCSPKVFEESKRKASELMDFVDSAEISAVTGEGLDQLVEKIVNHLPEGHMLYPEDMVVDVPIENRISELIREKILERTREEVPHAIAVEVEDIKEREDKNLIEIYAIIYVERDSQKGIIIGKGGRMLKDIGTAARLEIENLLKKHVYLNLRVKVKEDWREKESAVRMLY